MRTVVARAVERGRPRRRRPRTARRRSGRRRRRRRARRPSSRPTATHQCGIPDRKLNVPSMPSTTQRRRFALSALAPSSPRMPSAGRSARRSATMAASEAVSARLTKSVGEPLTTTPSRAAGRRRPAPGRARRARRPPRRERRGRRGRRRRSPRRVAADVVGVGHRAAAGRLDLEQLEGAVGADARARGRRGSCRPAAAGARRCAAAARGRRAPAPPPAAWVERAVGARRSSRRRSRRPGPARGTSGRSSSARARRSAPSTSSRAASVP